MMSKAEMLREVVENSICTILCVNAKEVIKSFAEGKDIDFNHLLDNPSLLSPQIDLESLDTKECLSKCIFNPSVATITFVEFRDVSEFYDDMIRPIYRCTLKDDDETSFYFSTMVPSDYLVELEKDNLGLIEYIAYSVTILKRIYKPQWRVLE